MEVAPLSQLTAPGPRGLGPEGAKYLTQASLGSASLHEVVRILARQFAETAARVAEVDARRGFEAAGHRRRIASLEAQVDTLRHNIQGQTAGDSADLPSDAVYEAPGPDAAAVARVFIAEAAAAAAATSRVVVAEADASAAAPAPAPVGTPARVASQRLFAAEVFAVSFGRVTSTARGRWHAAVRKVVLRWRVQRGFWSIVKKKVPQGQSFNCRVSELEHAVSSLRWQHEALNAAAATKAWVKGVRTKLRDDAATTEQALRDADSDAARNAEKQADALRLSILEVVERVGENERALGAAAAADAPDAQKRAAAAAALADAAFAAASLRALPLAFRSFLTGDDPCKCYPLLAVTEVARLQLEAAVAQRRTVVEADGSAPKWVRGNEAPLVAAAAALRALRSKDALRTAPSATHARTLAAHVEEAADAVSAVLDAIVTTGALRGSQAETAASSLDELMLGHGAALVGQRRQVDALALAFSRPGSREGPGETGCDVSGELRAIRAAAEAAARRAHDERGHVHDAVRRVGEECLDRAARADALQNDVEDLRHDFAALRRKSKERAFLLLQRLEMKADRSDAPPPGQVRGAAKLQIAQFRCLSCNEPLSTFCAPKRAETETPAAEARQPWPQSAAVRLPRAEHSGGFADTLPTREVKHVSDAARRTLFAPNPGASGTFSPSQRPKSATARRPTASFATLN